MYCLRQVGRVTPVPAVYSICDGKPACRGLLAVPIRVIRAILATASRLWLIPFGGGEVTSFFKTKSPRIVLLQLEGSAAYNLIVDHDVYLIGALSESARVQIVDVLAVIDSEE